jgi:hypothetical protein
VIGAVAWPVVLASVLQLLTAATFVALGSIAYVRGSEAQVAAEAEVLRQGHSSDLLARGSVNFKETSTELALPVIIAAVLAALAMLNLAGSQSGRVATWVLQSIIVLAGGFVTAQQVFAVRFVRSAFEKSGDEALASLDVAGLMKAATSVFPAWFRTVVVVRFALVTVGSLVVIVLLALPSSSPHYQ